MRVLSIFLNFVMLAIVATASLVGCDSRKEDQAEEVGVRKVKVGTYAAIPNISFYDAQGTLSGFDVELVREIAQRLPQYSFEFSSMEFPQLFLGLDTQRIDLIAMHLEKNEAREAKYLFNAEAYDWSRTTVGVHRDRLDINSIDDLAGKRVIVGAGGNPAFLIEDFNRNNPNPAKVVYSASFDDVVQQIKTGRVDATLIDVALLRDLNQKIDAQLKAVGPHLQGTTGIHFALRKDDTGLAGDLDKAVRAMKEDGSLERLSQQWLDRSYE